MWGGVRQLPGRENRLKEPSLECAKEAARQIVDNMGGMFEEKPYALFGHSSGCWIAYEVRHSNEKRWVDSLLYREQQPLPAYVHTAPGCVECRSPSS